jgi:hypothetical protein
MYPFPTHLHVPRETLGPIREAAASLSLSFLKVLFRTRCFRVPEAWWDIVGGRNSCGSSLFHRAAGGGIIFSVLSLVFRHFGLLGLRPSSSLLY